MAAKTSTLEPSAPLKKRATKGSSMLPPPIASRARVQPMEVEEWEEDERFRIDACGKMSAGPIRVHDGVGLSESIEKITRGVKNLTSIGWLSRGLELSKAVARIRTGQGSGTGFLIGPDLLITNHQVIPDPATAADAVADFNYQKDWNGRLAAVRRCRITAMDFETNEALDYSIVHVEGNPADEFGYFDVADHGIPAVNDYVTIIQHPFGGLKQIALAGNKVARVSGSVLQYTTEWEPGSCGSAVFDQDWRIVALHQKSGGLQAMNGRSHYINQGVLINRIVRDAQERLDLPDLLHELIFNELWSTLANVVHAEESFVAYIPLLAANEEFRRGLEDWIALNLMDTEIEDHQEVSAVLAGTAGVAAGAAIRHWGRSNQITVVSSRGTSSELVKLIDELKSSVELPSQLYYGLLSKADEVKRLVRRVVDEARNRDGSPDASQLDLLAFDQLGYVPANKLPILTTAFLAGLTAGAAAYDGRG